MTMETQKTILVVDDTESMRDLLRAHLERVGYTVIDAPGGISGVKTAKEQSPDLIICDLMMPDKGGYEVLSELQQDPTTRNIPFYILTAIFDSEVKAKGISQGAWNVFPKPFPMRELLESIKRDTENKTASNILPTSSATPSASLNTTTPTSQKPPVTNTTTSDVTLPINPEKRDQNR